MQLRLDECLPIGGCRIAAGDAGIRYKNRNDLVLFAFATGTVMAGQFTQNTFCAAPVQLAKAHLHQASPRWLLINAGNANAGTGAAGLAAAEQSCRAVAQLFAADPAEVLPFSTGVIGQQLPVDKIALALPGLKDQLDSQGWGAAARAIMTTDTQPKMATADCLVGAKTVRVSGIAKGSGMIHPNMATMLAFIATDLVLTVEQADRLNRICVNRSFNRISVDGDTSTNDACVLAATGASGVALDADNEAQLLELLSAVYIELAQKIVRDGEGATKFVTVRVEGGASVDECLRVARAIAVSPLVKTAWYASDPNWGRILAAVGNAGLAQLNPEGVNIYLDDVCIVHGGGLDATYQEAAGQAVFDQASFSVRVELGRGTFVESLWTCDLSHDYVTINAEYRS